MLQHVTRSRRRFPFESGLGRELCGLPLVADAVADSLSDSAPSFWTWQEQRGKAAVSGDWERPSEIRACQLRNCTPTAHVPSGQPSQLRPATCPERECYRIRWQRTKWVPEHPLFLCQPYLPATQARLYLSSSPFALLLFFLPRTSPRRPFSPSFRSLRLSLLRDPLLYDCATFYLPLSLRPNTFRNLGDKRRKCPLDANLSPTPTVISPTGKQSIAAALASIYTHTDQEKTYLAY